MQTTIKLIAANDPFALAPAENDSKTLVLSNDADAAQAALAGVQRIDLHFPKFTDGRAYSQAFALRKRCGFTGEIRATGDVLIDQLVQMQRTGFSSAVLKEGQNLAFAQAQFERFASFYQGDAVQTAPLFARSAVPEAA